MTSLLTRRHLVRTARAAACLGLLMGLALASLPAFAANDGQITSLNASGATGPGDCIDISSSIRADSSINNSNLYYELFAPSGARIATRQVNLPSMSSGDTRSDSWSYCNPPQTGTYEVHLVWSTGGSHNGDIDAADTGFYSIPTLGWWFGALSLALLGAFLYQRRAEFAVAPQ